MWQGPAGHRNGRTSLEPALCKLLFPCGTDRVRASGEARPPFTFEEFSERFVLLLVTDKGNDFNTSGKCLIISSCEIWVLFSESMQGMWISSHSGQCPPSFFFFTKSCYQVVVLVRNCRAFDFGRCPVTYIYS